MSKVGKQHFIGIDLFAGAGGMSIGAEMAGIKIVEAVEIDLFAATTYKHNHKDVNIHQVDIRTVTLKDNLPEGVRVVFGGPPCQGFSTSNQKTRNLKNPNNWLFQEYLRIVKETKPHWVIFENVKGILETTGGSFADEVVTGFESLGYTTSSMILNAADYGVPQKRNRYFIIASLEGHRIAIPKVHAGNRVTVNDAISDLPFLEQGASTCELSYSGDPSSEYSKKMRDGSKVSTNNLVSRNNAVVLSRYEHIPQGGNWENIPDYLMENYADKLRCHTGIYHRLMENEPSIVIGNYRKNMLIHPTEHRGLSVREAARLQSFPDKFKFYGSIGFQQQQVGNAVPPLLAKTVFEAVLNAN